MTDKKTVTLEEGAAMLIDRLFREPDADKRIADTVALLREAETKAVHEAAIVYKLGGEAALLRLFAYHGIKW